MNLLLITLFILVISSLLVIFLVKPSFCLIFTLIILYNPFFNFVFINTMVFSGGRIRILISIMSIFLLSLIVVFGFFSRRLSRSKTPLDKIFFLFLFFILISIFIGFIYQNDTKEILAEAMPLIEGGIFFYLTGFIIRNEFQINKLLKWLYFWLIFVFGCEIFFYFIFNKQFYHGLNFSGIQVVRCVDFLAPVIWPMLLTRFFIVKSRLEKIFIIFPLLLGLIIIVLGFFRSVWLAMLLSVFFIVFLLIKDKVIGVRKVLLMGLIALFALNLITILFSLTSSDSQVKIFEIIMERSSKEDMHRGTSYSGRMYSYKDLIGESLQNPIFGKGFGGKFQENENPISSSPSFFLNLLCEMGFIAFIIFGFSCLLIFYKIYKIYQFSNSIEVKNFSLGIMSSLLGQFIILNLFPSLVHFAIMPYLGVGIAIVFIQDKLTKVHNSNPVIR